MRSRVHELVATVELNIPAVLGGPEPRRCDPYFRVRPSSVRGGLRYWFRAAATSMLWPAKGRDPKAQADNDRAMLSTLRELESYVFGDTKGRSRVVVLPPEGGKVEPWRPVPDSKRQPGLRYLGYGLFEGKGTPPPERLIAPKGAAIELRLCLHNRPRPKDKGKERPSASDATLREVVAATLWLWTSFGGLGARVRRGYGSMQMVGLKYGVGGSKVEALEPFASLCELPNTNQEHLAKLQRGIGLAQEAVEKLVMEVGTDVGQKMLDNDGQRSHPQIRSLAGIAGLHTLNGETEDALDALEAAGALFQGFRSSLARTSPLPDYHAVKQSLIPPRPPPDTVERAAFGMPLNFYFRSLGRKTTGFLPRLPKGEQGDQPDRLASPLLVHVHALQGTRGRRRYGVTLVNLAGRNSDPLQGCTLRQRGNDRHPIKAPTGKLLDEFITWAVGETKRRPLRAKSASRRRGQRR